MLPDNIDDLFRQQLDGHTTPPAPDLWARLALPQADVDPVDATFQEGLRGHATPPRRELWERLEDEHLRPQPRRRRVVAWWQYSAAAVLLLMLVGGALWSGNYWPTPNGGQVASRGNGAGAAHTSSRTASELPVGGTTATGSGQPQAPITAQSQDVASTSPAAPKKNQEIFSTEATAPRSSTSSTPIANTTRPRRPATAPQASKDYQPKRSQPDAAMSTLAKLGGRKAPAGQTPSSLPTAPAVTTPTHANEAPILALAPAAPAATPEIIEVEVRRGAARPEATPVAVAVVAAAAPAPARRRGLRLGGLLRQADHLMHGELAEATGLPETVTLQARLGGRLVSKTIQL